MGLFDFFFGGGKSSDSGGGSCRKDYGRGSSRSNLCNSRAVSDGLRHGSSQSGRTMAQHRHQGRKK